MKRSVYKKINSILEEMKKCKHCNLYKNGMAIPFISKKSKYLIMAEAPGRDEVLPENQSPLVGSSGKTCLKYLKKLGFERNDFLIINSTNCRPVRENGSNGKPTFKQIERCRRWNKEIIKTFDPKVILSFGAYSLYFFSGEITGIMSKSGKPFRKGKRIIVPCIHPASVLYNKKNEVLFKKSLKMFKAAVKKFG